MTEVSGPPEPDQPAAEPDQPAAESDQPAAESAAAASLGPVPPAAASGTTPAVESTRRLLGASFDLLTRASDDMRRASFYVGLVVLGTVGPLALASLALEVVSVHKTGAEMERLADAGVTGWEGLLGSLAVVGLVVAAVESRIMASAILAGHLVGQPISIRESLARSRMVFWRAIVASIIVGIPVYAAQALLGAAFEAALGAQTDVSLVTSALVAAVVGAPLAYLLSGVVLGDVDPFEATRRSFRVFRARKVAAALVAVFETTAVLLVFLGLGAGLDIALRVFDALGLGTDSGPAGLALITIGAVVGVFALGTLIYTALAISIAPQVVMFVGLTHATFGLDHVRRGGDRDPATTHPGIRRFRWLTWPMRIGFVFGWIGLVVVVGLLAG